LSVSSPRIPGSRGQGAPGRNSLGDGRGRPVDLVPRGDVPHDRAETHQAAVSFRGHPNLLVECLSKPASAQSHLPTDTPHRVDIRNTLRAAQGLINRGVQRRVQGIRHHLQQYRFNDPDPFFDGYGVAQAIRYTRQSRIAPHGIQRHGLVVEVARGFAKESPRSSRPKNNSNGGLDSGGTCEGAR
jgi:hypothetical protein